MTTAPDPTNLLVVLPGPLGDAVLAAPALAHLRRALPRARVVFLGNPTVLAALEGAALADASIEGGAWSAGGNLLRAAAQLRRQRCAAAILLPNSFRSALAVYLAGVPRRIGYRRDARGPLLTDPVEPPRLPGRFAPVSMLDYYEFLLRRAVALLGGHDVPFDRRLRLATTPQDRTEVDALLQRWRLTATDRLVVLVPGAAYGTSKLWPAERFAALADRLTERAGCRVILCCAPNDAERQIAWRLAALARRPVFSLADHPLSLGGLKELVRRTALMVANDTGPCHLAAAFAVPLITLFGPTDPRWTATGYEKEIRLRVNVDCGPCQRKTCPARHHRCLEALDVDTVYAAALRLLNGAGHAPSAAGAEQPGVPGTHYAVYDELFAPSPDGGLIHRSYLPALERAGLHVLDGVFRLTQAQRLDKPNLGARERLRVELTDDRAGKVTLYVKRFGASPFVQRWRRALGLGGWTPGVGEFATTIALAECGLPVARPVACGQEQRGSRLGRSFVILEALPDADALERLLPRAAGREGHYRLLADRRQLVRELAFLVRRLHDHGWFHRDLYLAHVFLSRDAAGQERLNLIDLQRVFRPCCCRRRWQVKDLAQLCYSARPHCTRTEMLRFLRAYLGRPRLQNPDRRLLRRLWRKAQRIARRDQRRRPPLSTPPVAAQKGVAP